MSSLAVLGRCLFKDGQDEHRLDASRETIAGVPWLRLPSEAFLAQLALDGHGELCSSFPAGLPMCAYGRSTFRGKAEDRSGFNYRYSSGYPSLIFFLGRVCRCDEWPQGVCVGADLRPRVIV